MKNKIIIFVLIFSVWISYTQEKKKHFLKPYKIGFLYNGGTNENFIFNDPDYTYTTKTYKTQAFYKLAHFKKIHLELIVQPQIQFLKHQLLNEWYVTPDQDNFQEKIAEFTQPKNIHLYGLEFGFAAKRKLIKKLDLQGTVSLGFNFIDTRSERLAKGFTFIENFSIGFSYDAANNVDFYLGTNFGHVSNLDFKKPNDGYNVLGLEIGVSYILK